MTRDELIKYIGDTLTQIDTIIGSIDPRSPQASRLWKLRRQLDDYQRTLVWHSLNDNGAAYAQANQALKKAKSDLDAALADVNHLKDFLSSVVALVGAVGKLLTVGGALLA
jgi:hypothetical protein